MYCNLPVVQAEVFDNLFDNLVDRIEAAHVVALEIS